MEIGIQNAEVRFELPLFKIPNFSVHPGTHILVRGPSGIGKTTLLHLIAGLLRAHTGEVRVGTLNLTQATEAETALLRRNCIGIIFQKLNIIGHLTAKENVELAFGRKKSSDEVLREVGLYEKQDFLASVLSLGEQQRVAVARVLAQSPKIILADEPTSSLDGKNSELVMMQIKKAAKDNTLIVVSHDDRIVRDFSTVMDFREIIKK